jgi:hypothetical protein
MINFKRKNFIKINGKVYYKDKQVYHHSGTESTYYDSKGVIVDVKISPGITEVVKENEIEGFISSFVMMGELVIHIDDLYTPNETWWLSGFKVDDIIISENTKHSSNINDIVTLRTFLLISQRKSLQKIRKLCLSLFYTDRCEGIAELIRLYGDEPTNLTKKMLNGNNT